MTSTNHTTFNNVDQIGESLLMAQLESNLKTFIDWGFLGIGGFNNVTVPTSGAYGGTFDNMRTVDDKAYNAGQVWETPRKDWVWESGVEYGTQPLALTGVFIDSTLYPTGHATYAHHYNYPLGRVVFDTGIATTSTVQLNHSYRHIQTHIADQAPWFDELQYSSMRVEDSTFSQIGSGNWQILGNHRVQMPAVVIEAIPRRTQKPYQQGNVSQFVYQDVKFHVISESRWWRNQLVDILSLQKDKTIWLYDNNIVADSGAYALDHRGMKTGAPSMYPDLVSLYPYKKARFFNIAVTELESFTSRLHKGTVRVTFEVVIG